MDGEALRLKHAGLICCGLLLLLFGLARLGGLGFPLETPLPAEARHSSRRAKAGQPAQAPAALASQQALEIDGERVEILRDSFGVPHIFAKTLRGLFFGNGYAIAQDRLWQMERYRRTARGELAELEGEGAIRQDEDVRRLGYTEEERRLRWAEL
jgi:acyl-homoserine lactone acylase PvdQ